MLNTEGGIGKTSLSWLILTLSHLLLLL